MSGPAGEHRRIAGAFTATVEGVAPELWDNGMLPMDEELRRSGQYGPRIHVPDDADVQTQLLAFIAAPHRRIETSPGITEPSWRSKRPLDTLGSWDI